VLVQNKGRIANLNGGPAFENKKELPRAAMQVFDLGLAWRHTLLNDADLLAFDQMPAIANLAPDVMFGVLCVDGIHHLTSRAGQRARQRMDVFVVQLIFVFDVVARRKQPEWIEVEQYLLRAV